MSDTAQTVERASYTIDEAAAALGISRSTIKRRIADGTLRASKSFGRPLIPAASLRAALGETAEQPRRGRR